jgi:hypothetical protein
LTDIAGAVIRLAFARTIVLVCVLAVEPSDAITRPPTRTPRAPTPTPTSSLPDLLVDHARIAIPGFEGGCILGLPASLALHLCIKNQGGVAAGAFDVDVNDQFFDRVEGIDAGATVCALGPYTYPHDTHAVLDARQEVSESDEGNNEWSHFVPIPTRPPTCTVTPTATPLPRMCRGDCNDDRRVRVDELLLGVNITLGREPFERCPAYETCAAGGCVGLLVEAVGAALAGCP